MTSWLEILESTTREHPEVDQERLVLRAGEVLFSQEDSGDGMYVVVRGRLQAVIAQEGGGETALGEMVPGDTIGEVQMLTGGKRTAAVRAVEESEVVKLGSEAFEKLSERFPKILHEMLALARQRLKRSLLAVALHDLFGPLDGTALSFVESQVEWIQLQRGETLFEQGAAEDDFYVVLSGRLAAVVAGAGGSEQMVGEIVRGDCLGEMALFTGEPRSTSIRALRDALLAKCSKESFEKITARFPEVTFNVAKTLVRRLAETVRVKAGELTPAGTPATVGNARTVAVLPADGDVPGGELARRLAAALSSFGSTLHLSRERLAERFGIQATDREPAQTRLSAWLDDQELRFRFVVYEAEPGPTAWTLKCLRHADQVLLLVRPTPALEPGELKRVLASAGDDAAMRTALVMLHPDGTQPPRGTGAWCERLGLHRHDHLRWDRPEDCARLARFLSGQAVGLALGGGGARGLAHIGVIRALTEAGIPIDMIGGTSMGALMAAQFAMCGDPETMLEINRQAFLVGKPHRDVTLPVFGFLSGRRAERLLDEIFGDLAIEDLWLPFFAISANLTTARQVIHQSGAVTKAIRASASVPGAVTPVLDGDDLLVDGGVLNNLPGDVMRRLCGGRVILVDVSPAKDLTVTGVGERLPSPWKVLWSRVNPLAEKIVVPRLGEVLMRSSTLASTEKATLAKSAADLYLNPEVDRFGMFDLTAVDELVEIGYRHAASRIEEWDGPRAP